MKIKDIATSLTSIVFIVVGISGVMLYFKIFNGQVKELHEILGLAFVGAAIVHVFANWKPMKKYFTKKIFIGSFILVAIISGIFISQSLNNGSSPKKLILTSMINAPIETSIKVLNINYDKAIDKLKEKNMKILDTNSINTIAKANNVSPFKIISIITSK